MRTPSVIKITIWGHGDTYCKLSLAGPKNILIERLHFSSRDVRIILFSTQYPVAIMCPELLNPTNGMVDVRGRTIGSQAIYMCNDGYSASGLIIRTCSGSGRWTGQDTECIDTSLVTCPSLRNPIDGRVTIMSNQFQGGAIYSCDSGFSLVGLVVRTCVISGQWSGTPPTCLGNDIAV